MEAMSCLGRGLRSLGALVLYLEMADCIVPFRPCPSGIMIAYLVEIAVFTTNISIYMSFRQMFQALYQAHYMISLLVLGGHLRH